jgi:ribonucleoside-triphosphate reductase|nr:MAG TPA: anaerobic ribonucleoside triphosphate reductase [Caudoviricetes sp.]
MTVTKRDGRKVEFDRSKIVKAITKAFVEVYPDELPADTYTFCAKIADDIEARKQDMAVEEIQDIIVRKLMASKYKDVATQYVQYRYQHELIRQSNTTDKTIKELLDGENEYWKTENSNKNPKVVTTQRDYIAGVTSTDITRRFLLPKDIVEAHDEGVIHFHDADYYAQLSLHNCELINLQDMLQNGTVINGVQIDKPHRLITAATISTQIITAVTSSSYGGATINLSHLAPFVRDSREWHRRKYLSRGMSDGEADSWAMEDTQKEIADAVQTFNYQVNSMTNTNGQAPFLSVFMYLNDDPEYQEETALLIEEFLRQRILGFKNESGHYITPAFPKLLYVLDENNITEDSPYWYLTVLAAQCTSKRLVPDYISAKIMRRDKVDANGNGNVYGCMGCRSFLTPYLDAEGKPKYWGRFNQGVVTINLPDVALSSGGDMTKFWELLDERLELCHRALQCRHERLALATADVAPILWRYGALARLPKGAPIHPLLHDGYSTLSLGYAGLYECVKYMTGESHSHGKGFDFGIQVMERLNEYTAKWKAAEHIDYSLYGSPIETTTYKFATCLKRRFGEVEGITDHGYITNSYHINVREPIDPFEKLAIEAKYQKLSPGGAISYVETADLTQNPEAVLEVLKFIYDNIMYAELNTKSDYCQVCGYEHEIEIVDNDGVLSWRCPNCGNTDQSKMNVARRTCGYIGTQYWNQGRTEEIRDRYVHLDNHEVEE